MAGFMDRFQGGPESFRGNDEKMHELRRLRQAERIWAVEDWHGILHQTCNVERSQLRSSRTPRNQIGVAIRSLVRLMWPFFRTCVSPYELKRSIVCGAEIPEQTSISMRGFCVTPITNGFLFSTQPCSYVHGSPGCLNCHIFSNLCIQSR